MSEKSEEPTPRRLRKAREEGDSGASAQVAQAAAFVVAVALLPAAGTALAAHSTDALRQALARAADAAPEARFSADALASAVIGLSTPLLLAVGLTGAVATLMQTGGLVAAKKLNPKLAHLDLAAGLAKLVSPTRVSAVVRALMGASLIGYLAYRALTAHAIDLARLAGRTSYIGGVASELAISVLRDAALLGLALAAVDLAVTRRSWMRRLRMSKEDVKRDYKESEGDPEARAARRRAHEERMTSAVLGTLKMAAIVVASTNAGTPPAALACALRYDRDGGDDAPVVIASGDGEVAAQITRAAIAVDVPVVHDVALARALRDVAVGEAIPEALYEAVAEALRVAWETSTQGVPADQ